MSTDNTTIAAAVAPTAAAAIGANSPPAAKAAEVAQAAETASADATGYGDSDVLMASLQAQQSAMQEAELAVTEAVGNMRSSAQS
jgi:hypothetical protein